MVLRGVEERQEQDPGMLLRDTRTNGQKIYDFFQEKLNVGVTLLVMAIASFVFPQTVDLAFFIGVGFFIYALTRKAKLPFRMPQHSGVLDYNDLSPGNNKPRKAQGILFLGNEKKTNAELWFSNEDMRTHMLIFGSTGSGKTETLLSLAFGALVQGSGFIYVDGKGDNSLFAKIFSMTRSMGREDDILLINFMTGARDIIGPQEKRLSNTMNPFALGSSSMLAQLVISMMDQAAGSPDGDMWKGRAISFVEALMKVLVAVRDAGELLLDANAVRRYFTLDRIESIVVDKVFPRDGREPLSLESFPIAATEPISNYLDTLPGYDKSKKGKQSPQTLEQHGFITMQLTRVFTSLADTYGHILRTNLAEVDMKDVVLNRRILVVLLPAMEKSPAELSNLGKIIIATLKAMMAAGLGDEVEGTYSDLVERKPTNAPTPYLCILDEYGYYAVEGFAVVPAQARSLGFSAIFAGQDLPAFEKASKEEAASIGANTNIKIAMKLEDPVQTWEFFQKTAGEAYVTKVDAFQTQSESLTNAYSDTRSSSFERRARIDLLDLKDQGVGEMHVFHRSKIVRAKSFYANPPAVAAMRLNHFLKVAKPDTANLIKFEQQLAKFNEALQSRKQFIASNIESEEVDFLAKHIRENTEVGGIERGVAVLIAFHNQTVEQQQPEEEEAIAPEQLNLFTTLRLADRSREALLISDFDSFSSALINKMPTRDQVQYIERISGKSEKHAENIAEEIIKDMQLATYYPPGIPSQPSGDAVAGSVNQIIDDIIQKRQAIAESTDT